MPRRMLSPVLSALSEPFFKKRQSIRIWNAMLLLREILLLKYHFSLRALRMSPFLHT